MPTQLATHDVIEREIERKHLQPSDLHESGVTLIHYDAIMMWQGTHYFTNPAWVAGYFVPVNWTNIWIDWSQVTQANSHWE